MVLVVAVDLVGSVDVACLDFRPKPGLPKRGWFETLTQHGKPLRILSPAIPLCVVQIGISVEDIAGEDSISFSESSEFARYDKSERVKRVDSCG